MGEGRGSRVLAVEPLSGKELRDPTCSAGQSQTGPCTEDPAWRGTQNTKPLGLNPLPSPDDLTKSLVV